MPTEADKKNFLIPPLTGFLSGVLSHTRMSAPPIREDVYKRQVKKIDGQKVQEVRIIYNFVGEIPEITE